MLLIFDWEGELPSEFTESFVRENCVQWLVKLLLTDVPMVTGGTTGSMEEGLALTGMGVVGPFTITWPGYEHKNREYKSDGA